MQHCLPLFDTVCRLLRRGVDAVLQGALQGVGRGLQQQGEVTVVTTAAALQEAVVACPILRSRTTST